MSITTTRISPTRPRFPKRARLPADPRSARVPSDARSAAYDALVADLAVAAGALT
jgi:hypothetical protein